MNRIGLQCNMIVSISTAARSAPTSAGIEEPHVAPSRVSHKA